MQYKQIKYIVVENGSGFSCHVKFPVPEMAVICVVDTITVLPSLCFHKWVSFCQMCCFQNRCVKLPKKEACDCS